MSDQTPQGDPSGPRASPLAADTGPEIRHGNGAGGNPASIIATALPYMQRYSDEIVVVKFGGHAMGDAALSAAFAEDIVMLRQSRMRPVVVHGGGPQIAVMLDRLGIESRFSHGLRVTSREAVEIVEMVLAGPINKEIVRAISECGGRAVGICGKDAGLVTARKLQPVHKAGETAGPVDLGCVGEPDRVDPSVIHALLDAGLIPVVAPVAAGPDGTTYNINGDSFAGSLAAALGARRLLFLTDVPGVLDEAGRLIRQLGTGMARDLITRKVIGGGMIPKVETSIAALENGVRGVVIVNGRVPHAVLLELLTQNGAGTMIRS